MLRSKKSSVTPMLLVLCSAVFMAGLDAFVVNIAFDSIVRDFPESGQAQVSWVLNGYLIAFAALLVPFGRVADHLGNKRIFLVGVSLFTVASALCAVSPSLWILVAFRVVQGAGAAAMTPSSLGLILTLVPQAKRASSVKIWASTSGVATAFGPVVGGFLVKFGWQWAFLINIPVGVIAFVVSLFILKESHKPNTPLPDFLGALLLMVTAASLTYGLVEGAVRGWGDPFVIGSFAVFLAVGAIFYLKNRRAPGAIVPVSLFATPTYSWASATALVFNMGFGSAMLAIVLWLQQARGLSEFETGIAVFFGPLMVPIFSSVSQRWSATIGAGKTASIGCLIVAVSAVALAVVAFLAPATLLFSILAWVLMGVGVGLALPTILSSATVGLPPELASTGSAVVNMSRQIGMGVGVAILMSILATNTVSGSANEFGFAWIFVGLMALFASCLSLGMTSKTST